MFSAPRAHLNRGRLVGAFDFNFPRRKLRIDDAVQFAVVAFKHEDVANLCRDRMLFTGQNHGIASSDPGSGIHPVDIHRNLQLIHQRQFRTDTTIP